MLTDALLVLSPIPAIVRSSFTTLKKIRLIITVFSLSLLCIAFAGYRVPAVIRAHGSQQLRSLLASFELLLATAVSNAIVINSFARDKGVKKRKFSGETGIQDAEAGQVRMAYWGSDDDLARYIGVGRVPGINAEGLQKGYGLSEHDKEELSASSQVPRAVLHGAASPPREMETWKTKDTGHEAPAMPPPWRDNEVLYDVGNLLREDEEDIDDDVLSRASSSIPLRDIVGSRDGELRR
jgi:hypothetical protein